MSKLTKVTASKQSSSRRDIFQGNSTEPACLPHPVPVSNLAFGLSRVILKASWLGCSSRWDMEMSLARKSPHLWLSKHPLTYLHYQCIREFEKSWDHNPLWDNCFVFGMHFSLPRLASGKGGAVWIAFQRKMTWFPSLLGCFSGSCSFWTCMVRLTLLVLFSETMETPSWWLSQFKFLGDAVSLVTESSTETWLWSRGSRCLLLRPCPSS